MQVTFIAADTWIVESQCVLEAVHIENLTAIMEKFKHDILSVSKSVAWYPIYVHIKICLEMGHTRRAWRQVKIIFIPATGEVNYTQAKGYCPNSLLPFM